MLGRPVLAMGFEPVLSQWPPLRLTRLCREHVSVGVVCPLLSCPAIRDALEVCGESGRVGHPSRFLRGRDP
jgi:hypothetical protein